MKSAVPVLDQESLLMLLSGCGVLIRGTAATTTGVELASTPEDMFISLFDGDYCSEGGVVWETSVALIVFSERQSIGDGLALVWALFRGVLLRIEVGRNRRGMSHAFRL